MNLDDFAARMAAQFSRPAVPLSQQLDTLRRLNLPVPAGRAEALLAAPERYEREPYTALLTQLAREGSSQVLSLEAEVSEVSALYRNLLSRLCALTDGEVVLEEVWEDGGKADREASGGTWQVGFTLHGHPYSYDAAFLGNWLDLDLLPFLNQVLEAEGFRKRFITVDDARLSDLLVFYRTPEWARFFAAGTGLTVKDS